MEFRLLNTNWRIVISFWTGFQYFEHATALQSVLVFCYSSRLHWCGKQSVYLWNKIWPNGLGVTKEQNYLSSAFLLNPTQVYTFCEVRKVPWCDVGIDHFAAWSLSSPASKRSPQHSIPHIKKYVSQETRCNTPVCVLSSVTQFVMLHVLVSPTTYFKHSSWEFHTKDMGIVSLK